MYLIVYKGKDAQALQENNSAEIPNTYKIQPFPPSLITATSVPESSRDQVSGVPPTLCWATAWQAGVREKNTKGETFMRAETW